MTINAIVWLCILKVAAWLQLGKWEQPWHIWQLLNHHEGQFTLHPSHSNSASHVEQLRKAGSPPLPPRLRSLSCIGRHEPQKNEWLALIGSWTPPPPQFINNAPHLKPFLVLCKKGETFLPSYLTQRDRNRSRADLHVKLIIILELLLIPQSACARIYS